MSKGRTPAAPDYAGAAREQGAANVASGIASAIMGRPNVVSPTGTQTWRQTGTTNVGGYDIPLSTGEFSLSPEMQRIFGQAVSGASQPFDPSKAPGVADTAIDRNSVRDALVARQEASIGRDRENTRSDLIARGIPEGSEAFNREMDRLDRMTVDARQQAELGAGQAQSQALDSRRQLIQEALLGRQTPINELSALLSGTQLQSQGGAGGPSIRPPDIMGAEESSYGAALDRANARNAAAASNTNAAASIIGAYLLSLAPAASDIRLKSNIVKVGEHPLGIGVYSYDIGGKREVGVMAQELAEVMPEAVVTMPNGYYGVYYDMIGGRPS